MTTANLSLTRAALVAPHNLEAEKSVLGAVLLDERHVIALVADEQLAGREPRATAACPAHERPGVLN